MISVPVTMKMSMKKLSTLMLPKYKSNLVLRKWNHLKTNRLSTNAKYTKYVRSIQKISRQNNCHTLSILNILKRISPGLWFYYLTKTRIKTKQLQNKLINLTNGDCLMDRSGEMISWTEKWLIATLINKNYKNVCKITLLTRSILMEVIIVGFFTDLITKNGLVLSTLWRRLLNTGYT